MADSVEMQGIEFQIVNDSAAAAAGIEVLAKKLSELKSAISGSSTALSKVADGISQIKNAVNGMNTGDFASKMNSISTALANLKTQTDSLKISSSIGNQLSEINRAIAALPDEPGDKLGNLANALRPLSELGRSNMTSFINQLKKLPEVIAELEKADIDKFTEQMRALADAMKPFADEMNKVASGFSAFPSKIQKLIKSTDEYNNVTRKATANTSSWDRAMKGLSFIAIYRAAVKLLSGAIGKASQYTEDLNLFTVSMGQYAEEAYNYAQKVSEVVGIDPAEWMRNQGVFNTIITGFGVAGDKAAYMSKNLTQLSYDLASFYNIDFESAMQKVQSGIAGELEPLRRLGYDLSVARLEQERLNLGIDKSVSSMTQAEKSQLRYYAMMTQVTEVQGDMGRTLEQPANMLRVLQAQLQQAARAIGSLFIPVLTKILPIAIAVANALRQIIAAIALLFGVTLNAPDWGDSFGNAASGSGAIADNMDSAAGSAKELKKYLAGFDELNVLPEQNKSGGGSGAGGGGGGDLGLDLPGYDFLKDAVSQKIEEWKAKLEPLVSFVKDNLEEILKIVGTIGVALLAWKLSIDFLSSISALKKMSSNGLSIPLTISAGVILTAAGFTIEFSGIKDAIEKKLNGLNFGEIILGGLTGTAGAGLLGKGIGQFIAKAFGESAVAQAITAGGGTISTGLIGAAIGGIVAGIPMFVTGVYDAIMNGLNTLNTLLIPAGSTLAGAGIGAIIGSLGGPIGAGIGALIGLAVGALTDLGLLIYQKWDEIKAFFAPAAEWFSTNIFQPIAAFAENAWNKIVEIFSPAVSWFSELWDSVSKTFEDIFYNIGVIAKGTWEVITVLWGKLTGWVDSTIVQPLAQMFSSLWNSVVQVATDAWNKICNVFSTAYGFINSRFIQPIGAALSTAFDGAVGAIKVALNGVISVLNSALNFVFSAVNNILGSLRNLSIFGITPFTGLRDINIPQIPALADGGFVDKGQLFIAREAGAEMVGSIGNRTAVANNDQIVEGITYGVREANDDVVTAIYAVGQQVIAAMREQDSGSGGSYDFDRAVYEAQRRNARVYG